MKILSRQWNSKKIRNNLTDATMFTLRLVTIFCILLQIPCFAEKFTIRNDGTVLRDGIPFYPIGIYREGSAATSADLQKIAAAGFNFVHLDPLPSNGYTAVLDEAWRQKLYVMTYVADGNPVDIVNKYKSHPAVLGWDIADDAHRKYTADQIDSWNRSVKSADPDHFTYLTVYDPSVWGPYMNLADVIGPYKYPVYTSAPNLFLVDERMRLAYAATVKLFGIPQAYAWPDNRMPTAKEYRNMSYQNIANNVKGHIPYTFAWCNNIPDFWNEVTSVNAEIKRLAPVIMDGTFARMDPGATHVTAARWRFQDSMYVIIINTDASGSKTLSLQLPAGTTGPAKPLFANRPGSMAFSSGKLTGSINGADVHVYVLAAAPSTAIRQNVLPVRQDGNKKEILTNLQGQKVQVPHLRCRTIHKRIANPSW